MESPQETLKRAVTTRLNHKGLVRLNTRHDTLREVRSPTFGHKLRPTAISRPQSSLGTIDLGTGRDSTEPPSHTLFPVTMVERYLAEQTRVPAPTPLPPVEGLRRAIRTNPVGVFKVPVERDTFRGDDHSSPSMRSRILHAGHDINTSVDDLTEAARVGFAREDMPVLERGPSKSDPVQPLPSTSLANALISLRGMIYKTANGSFSGTSDMAVLASTLEVDTEGLAEGLIVKRNALMALHRKAMGLKRRLPFDGPERALWNVLLSECVDAAEAVSRALQQRIRTPAKPSPALHVVEVVGDGAEAELPIFGSKLDVLLHGFAERAVSQMQDRNTSLLEPPKRATTASAPRTLHTRPPSIPIGMPPLFLSRRRKQKALMNAMRFGNKGNA